VKLVGAIYEIETGPSCGFSNERQAMPVSLSQISLATDSLERLRTRRPSGIATRCRRLGSRARDARCSR
jgi:hypothetical protein